MDSPDKVQQGSTDKQLNSADESAPAGQSGKTRAGQTVIPVKSSDVSTYAENSLRMGGDIEGRNVRALTNVVGDGETAPNTQKIDKFMYALKKGELSAVNLNVDTDDEIDEGLDELDDLELDNLEEFEELIESGGEIDIPEFDSFVVRELSNIGVKFDLSEADYETVAQINDGKIKLSKINNFNADDAEFLVNSKFEILTKSEESKQKLLEAIAIGDFEFDDNMDPELKRNILSNSNNPKITVVGDVNWGRIFRVMLLATTVKKIEQSRPEFHKETSESSSSQILSKDRNFVIKYGSGKLKNIDVFSLITSLNRYSIKYSEILSNISKQISELKEELKEQDRQDKLKRIIKELKELQRLKLEVKNIDKRIVFIIEGNKTTFLKYLKWRDRKFMRFSGMSR